MSEINKCKRITSCNPNTECLGDFENIHICNNYYIIKCNKCGVKK